MPPNTASLIDPICSLKGAYIDSLQARMQAQAAAQLQAAVQMQAADLYLSDVLEKHLYNVPLEQLQDLIAEHLPEYLL